MFMIHVVRIVDWFNANFDLTLMFCTCVSFFFQGENILMVELDMPNRTTRDYDGPAVAPRIQAALDAALQDEEDIDIDGG